MNCACGTGKTYEDCCGLFISGKVRPSTAEALMRSRYTAFAKAEIDYLKSTLAPESGNDFDAKATKQWATKSEWKGLKILSTKKGGPSDDTGVVEFIATYRQNGVTLDHHEVSEFRKENGKWLFVNGESHTHKEGEDHDHHHKAPQVTVLRDAPKIGRNDPCTCGSGKKYKKCHGAQADA